MLKQIGPDPDAETNMERFQEMYSELLVLDLLHQFSFQFHPFAKFFSSRPKENWWRDLTGVQKWSDRLVFL
jgi:hypothetical protein